MARITIKDLPKEMIISKEEMQGLWGGFSPSISYPTISPRFLGTEHILELGIAKKGYFKL